MHHQIMMKVMGDMSYILTLTPYDVGGIDTMDAYESAWLKHGPSRTDCIPKHICRLLDDKYFPTWTDRYATHFVNQKWKGSTSVSELIGMAQEDELRDYKKYLSLYYDDLIAHAEELKETIPQSGDAEKDLVIKWMPTKLRALKAGLMKSARKTGSTLSRYYPVPNKLLLYTIEEQLLSIKDAISEVSDSSELGRRNERSREEVYR